MSFVHIQIMSILESSNKNSISSTLVNLSYWFAAKQDKQTRAINNKLKMLLLLTREPMLLCALLPKMFVTNHTNYLR